MALVPKSTVGRALAAIWLLMCIGMLLFAWVQQDIHDMPEAFAWLMIFLTMPIGLPVTAAVGITTSEVSKALGIAYQPFWDLVPMWIAVTLAGYLQWFVLLPWLWRRFYEKRAI